MHVPWLFKQPYSFYMGLVVEVSMELSIDRVPPFTPPRIP